MYALADADDQNPNLDFFYHLGNTIQYGDTSDNYNEYNTEGLAGVDYCDNQKHEIPEVDDQEEILRVATPDREENPGVVTPEEEEEIPEM